MTFFVRICVGVWCGTVLSTSLDAMEHVTYTDNLNLSHLSELNSEDYRKATALIDEYLRLKKRESGDKIKKKAMAEALIKLMISPESPQSIEEGANAVASLREDIKKLIEDKTQDPTGQISANAANVLASFLAAQLAQASQANTEKFNAEAIVTGLKDLLANFDPKSAERHIDTIANLLGWNLSPRVKMGIVVGVSLLVCGATTFITLAEVFNLWRSDKNHAANNSTTTNQTFIIWNDMIKEYANGTTELLFPHKFPTFGHP